MSAEFGRVRFEDIDNRTYQPKAKQVGGEVLRDGAWVVVHHDDGTRTEIDPHPKRHLHRVSEERSRSMTAPSLGDVVTVTGRTEPFTVEKVTEHHVGLAYRNRAGREETETGIDIAVRHEDVEVIA